MTKSKRTKTLEDYAEQTQALARMIQAEVLEEYRREALASLAALEDTLSMVDIIQDQLNEMTAELYNHRGHIKSLLSRIFPKGIDTPISGISSGIQELHNATLN